MSSNVLIEVQRWFEECVLGLNLCPFARIPHQKESIKFVLCDETELVSAAKSVINEVEMLRVVPDSEIDTVLVVFSRVLEDFDTYLDLLDFLNETLELNNLDDAFQFASFHPNYCFEGESEGARSNYTNRAPYPIIHILRNASMSKAIAAYGKERVDEVPFKNINTLEALSENEFAHLFERHVKHKQN